jgi:flagellar FliJ protein
MFRKKKMVKRVIEQRSKAADDRSDQGAEGVDVPRFQIHTSFLQKLNYDLESGYREIKVTEQKVKAQEAVVISEMIKRKALEKLKEKRFQTYLHETGREEQKFLDELAINKRGIRT